MLVALFASAWISPLMGLGELAPPVRLEAGGKVIDMGKEIAHAGPALFDLDGDGKRDLLVGNFKGTIATYANVSAGDEIRFEPRGNLKAEGTEVTIKNW